MLGISKKETKESRSMSRGFEHQLHVLTRTEGILQFNPGQVQFRAYRNSMRYDDVEKFTCRGIVLFVHLFRVPI
jgi:hypothetical protein